MTHAIGADRPSWLDSLKSVKGSYATPPIILIILGILIKSEAKLCNLNYFEPMSVSL